MKIKNILARSRGLRKFSDPILALLDFECAVKHAFSARPFYLRGWVHKSYWYYQNAREELETELIREIVSENWDVLEVGAHIGYVTQIFEVLCPEGKIVVVEPTPSSIRLLEKNCRSQTILVKAAASNEIGFKTLFQEQHGGFCNSIDPEFVRQADERQKKISNLRKTVIREVQVPLVTLDSVCDLNGLRPKFIKIDVEGWELNVLKGAEKTLAFAECVMVEVFRDVRSVYSFLIDRGFKPYYPNRRPIHIDRLKEGNIFFVRPSIEPIMQCSV